MFYSSFYLQALSFPVLAMFSSESNKLLTDALQSKIPNVRVCHNNTAHKLIHHSNHEGMYYTYSHIVMGHSSFSAHGFL